MMNLFSPGKHALVRLHQKRTLVLINLIAIIAFVTSGLALINLIAAFEATGHETAMSLFEYSPKANAVTYYFIDTVVRP